MQNEMSQKPSLSPCVFLGTYMKIDVIVRLVSDLPSIDPCGTPSTIFSQSLCSSFIFTLCFLLVEMNHQVLFQLSKVCQYC